MAQATFRHQQRVTYADCTLGNHVYYARYLDILEAARGDFFRSLGCPLSELQHSGVTFPVTECHLQYRQPARYDELVITELRLTHAKGARLCFAYRLVNERGNVLLTGETLHACASPEEQPRRIPEDLLERLRPYMPTPLE